MRTVEEALSQILKAVKPGGTQRTPLLESLGLVLAEGIVSDIPIPPFSNSAVDGYAVRAEDTLGADRLRPVILKEAGEILAGQVSQESVASGTAMRIMTGAPIPPGADALVMIEDCVRLSGNRVEIHEAAESGRHVRLQGEDIRQGEVVLSQGTLIRPAEIAMLATMGRSNVLTYRKPRVAVISTGDEVVEIETGIIPPPGKIRNSNRYALAAMVIEAGGIIHSLTHIPDDLEKTKEALRMCAEADVIVTAGGVSVGDRDYVKPALEALGTLELWQVAMKPGKPLAFGRIGHTLFFGLPGNPVSAMVTFELFVRPALWKMAGRAEKLLTRMQVQAKLTHSIRHAPGRREYVRVSTFERDGELFATPTGAQGSGILRSMTLSDSLLIIPAEYEDMDAGEQAIVILTG